MLYATAVSGAFLFVRSWTLFFPDSYPDVAGTIDKVEDGDLDETGYTFWIYLAVFIVLTIVNICFQKYRLKTAKDMSNDDEFFRA